MHQKLYEVSGGFQAITQNQKDYRGWSSTTPICMNLTSCWRSFNIHQTLYNFIQLQTWVLCLKQTKRGITLGHSKDVQIYASSSNTTTTTTNSQYIPQFKAVDHKKQSCFFPPP
ncbi:hypothetical protein QJS10_CPA05g01312 [Acorus calamus]|uniref:Uncharacterized protein n=1 Tax=Acorus calamus TaxID=4465 RepID=A0AAV9ET77_ACOCL|nr:hypothetical protein QJS10_CPA05g01312 [Acorus calamus]